MMMAKSSLFAYFVNIMVFVKSVDFNICQFCVTQTLPQMQNLKLNKHTLSGGYPLSYPCCGTTPGNGQFLEQDFGQD